MPKEPTVFINPYEGTPHDESTKTTVTISTKDYSFLVALHSRRGTFQTTVNLLIKRLVNELKRIRLTAYDPDAYEFAVAGSVLTCPRVDPGPITFGGKCPDLGGIPPDTGAISVVGIGGTVADDEPHDEAPVATHPRGTGSMARSDTRGAKSPVVGCPPTGIGGTQRVVKGRKNKG